MPRILKTLPACLACSFLGGLLVFAQPAAEKKPAPPPRSPAEQLFDAAIVKTGNLRAFDTTFTHTVLVRGTKMKTKGRLALAPKQKVYYELQVQIADGKGTIKILCDGQTIYRVQQAGEDKRVTKYELEKLDAARDELKDNKEGGEPDPVLVQEVLDDVASEHGFLGVTGLLRDLSKWLVFTRYESTVLTRDGQSLPAYLLEGEWNKETVKKIAPPKQSTDPNAKDPQKLWEERKPEYLMFPRKCRIVLSRDGGWPWTESLWPLRIEWWGQATAGAADEVLVTIDYALPARQTPPDSLFQLTEDEKKLEAKAVDPRELVRSRRASRLRAQAGQDTGVPATTSPPRKP